MKDKGSKRPLEKNGNGSSKKARVYHEEPGECGIIESISLRNFMCHDNLKFDFDPHMNFIIGENGSGKSAILTGIILALGGKSSITGRYSNLKGFIKNGKNSATVSVTLRNTGVQAYKPDVYGEQITVDRILNLDGTGSYKMKSEAGQIISTSKEELTNILNAMDIQIDNPVAVLTQEISRGFLNLQNSKKLFELFYKGTGLQRAEEEYNRACCERDEAESELKQKKKAIPEIEKEVERLKTYVESSVRLLDYNKELLWAEVIEMEKQTKGFAKDCGRYEKDIGDTKALIKRSKEVYLKTCQELDKYKKDKEDCDAMHCTLRNELMNLNAKGSELSNKVREMQGSLNRLQRESDTMLEEISSLENTIRENQLRNQNTFEEERKRHEEKIKNLKEKLFELRKFVAEYEEKKNQHLHGIESLDRQIETLQAEIQQSEYHFLNVTKEVQQLKDAVKSHINVFGPEMKNVLKDIEEAYARNEFRKKPKGPIGAFLVVKNPEWNLAIEECLGSWFLRNFCCDNHHDSEKLMNILSRHYTGNKIPGTIVSQYLPTVHNIETFKVQSSYSTVYDMLEVKDPVIANCLIDQKRIESTILIADTDEAFKVMMNAPPKNCQSAYTLNGDLIIPSPFRCYSCRPRNRMSVLKSLNEEDIRNKEAELAAIIEEKDGKKKIQASIRNERHEEHREIVKLESHIGKLKVEEYELCEKMKDLVTNLPQKKHR